jgi:flagellin FlaB
VFIALVLVAAIAAGVLINTAGFLQSSAEATGEQSQSQVTNRIQVTNAVGQVNSSEDPNTVKSVELTVSQAPGADDINLEAVTIQYISDTGTAKLVSDSGQTTANSDGTFTISPFKDDDASITESKVINDPADRAILNISDFGVSTSSGIDGVTEPAEGQTITLQLSTQSGGEISSTLVVPESLTSKSAVSL